MRPENEDKLIGSLYFLSVALAAAVDSLTLDLLIVDTIVCFNYKFYLFNRDIFNLSKHFLFLLQLQSCSPTQPNQPITSMQMHFVSYNLDITQIMIVSL